MVKERIKRKRKSKIRTIIILGGVILVSFSSFIIARKYFKRKLDLNLIEKGCLELKNLDNKNIEEIEGKILLSRSKKEESSIPENKERNINMDNKEYFSKDLFMGDSITEAMPYYKVLNDSSVIAKKGETTVKAHEYIDKVVSKNPERIFLMYGMNDLTLFSSSDDFIKEYSNLIEKIQKNLPKTKIYVQSILPVEEKAVSKNKDLSRDRVYEFNNAINKMAKELKVNYINLTSTIENKDNFYEPDGIHPKANFYSIWLDYIKNTLK
ncbi:GDSL-type esterase/lipase family protein [Clostridium hydrogeniformans]|uniref:GDSL-type esterase/lipase family protein n=1 Tax=Clostridium hydrogeniformans TaxID=349933 RepID=UPI00047FEC74|nr:GDSL-type esterase/lipase family protein [Clostridium hydrogeniformans]